MLRFRFFGLTLLLTLLGVIGAPSEESAWGALVPFRLEGSAGLGLLPGNETVAVTGGGTGGIVGAGIRFDDTTRNLFINVAWGSLNGFTNLSGAANQMHIHGPASFTQASGILLTIDTEPGFNASATNGGFSGFVNIPVANVADLLAGRLYLNVHTPTNGNGEIRGNLVAVPEPSSLTFLALAAAAGVTRLRRPNKAMMTVGIKT